MDNRFPVLATIERVGPNNLRHAASMPAGGRPRTHVSRPAAELIPPLAAHATAHFGDVGSVLRLRFSMSTPIRLRKLAIGAPAALISAALVALMLTSGLLAARVWQLRARLATLLAAERARVESAVGTSIPTFTAYGLDSAQLPVVFERTAEAQRTLFFVYSPECRICDVNWPQWNRVRTAAESPGTRQLFIDLSATSSAPYLTRYGITSTHLITHVPAAVAGRLRLGVTPQLILTNQQGEVTGVWTGTLTELDVEEVIRRLGNRNGVS